MSRPTVECLGQLYKLVPWLTNNFRLWRDVAGDADAYGTIADCYTDLDMFEQAADYYDKYIQCMNKDGPV